MTETKSANDGSCVLKFGLGLVDNTVVITEALVAESGGVVVFVASTNQVAAAVVDAVQVQVDVKTCDLIDEIRCSTLAVPQDKGSIASKDSVELKVDNQTPMEEGVSTIVDAVVLTLEKIIAFTE